MSISENSSNSSAGNFSTFAGVFTPSILTILGVIMFMRAGFVIGHAGVINTLIILLIAKSITTLTTFSISAISTNMEVRGGGAYYLISRTLGPEFGGTIGITLFLAQVLSIPFYIIGFTEALTTSFEALAPWSTPISFATGIAVFIVTMRGASDAIKVQYVILGILSLSILSFVIGGLTRFDMDLFYTNLFARKGEGTLPFWALFAIYFPAVTGIMAGVNMSGDLKNPSKSIPNGTFLAIGAGAVVYGIQALIMGGTVDREVLIASPYKSLLDISLFGIGFIVTLGVFAATLSSALGSFVGSPRILSALAADRILSPLKPFEKLHTDGEPRRAIYLSFTVTLLVLIWAASAGDNALNIVASLVSMFFLWTYGIINIAAFIESFGKNPSFRPRFKLFHWLLALLGAIGCLGAAVLIDATSAFVALLTISGIFLYVRRTLLTTTFGDARRGFYYSRIRTNLNLLADTENHPKNWRPTILLFTQTPHESKLLTKFAHWISGNRGIVILAQVVVGEIEKEKERYVRLKKELANLCKREDVNVFPQVLYAFDFTEGVDDLLQCCGIGELRPNLVFLQWPGHERARELIPYLQKIKLFDMSSVMLNIPQGWTLPDARKEKRIDIWWRGEQNGSLIAILAWLLSSNNLWPRTKIRFLRKVSSSEERIESEKEIAALIHGARIEAEIHPVIDNTLSFTDVFHRESSDATAVFLGFTIPNEETAERFIKSGRDLTEGMPPLFFVNSSGDADLLA